MEKQKQEEEEEKTLSSLNVIILVNRSACRKKEKTPNLLRSFSHRDEHLVLLSLTSAMFPLPR